MLPGKWSKKKKNIKLQDGQIMHYKNSTIKTAFQITNCSPLETTKSAKPSAAASNAELSFQLLVQGIDRSHFSLPTFWSQKRQKMVLGFETAEELRTCEEAIRWHILPQAKG